MAGALAHQLSTSAADAVQGAGERSRSIAYQVVLHALAVALVCLIDLIFASPTLTLIVGGMIIMLTYARISALEFWRAPLGLSPLSFYFLWYAIGLGASAIYIGNLLTYAESVPFSAFHVWQEDVRTGYLIYLAGSLFLHIGIQLFRPAGEVSSRDPHSSHRAVTILPMAFCYLAGVTFLLWPKPFALLGSLASPLAWAGLSVLCSFALCEPQSLGLTSAPFAAILSLGTVGLFIANLNTGSKARIMFSLLPVVWLFMMRRSLRQWLLVLAVAGILLYSGVYRVVTLSRALPHDESQDSMSRILEAYAQISSGQASGEDAGDEDASEQAQTFLGRQFDPLPVGFLVEEVNERGFMYGKTMAYGLYAWIPRILWPGKPVVSRGAWFTAFLGAARDASVATTSTGETAIGELYWNFGMPGVIAGMLLTGAFIGVLWRMAGADPHRRLAHMLLYMFLMLEIVDQAEEVTYLMGLIADFIIFGAMFSATEIVRSMLMARDAGVTEG